MRHERTLTRNEAEFLGRVYDCGRSGLYLRGPDLRHFRALKQLDVAMVRGGRLDPDRYAVLTERGETFVENMRGL